MNNAEKKHYEIIQYGNPFNALDLSEFRVVENRFLMAFLYKCKDRKPEEEITMTKEDLLGLEVYQPNTKISPRQFKRDLVSTLKKCSALSFHSIAAWDGKVPNKGILVPLFSFIDYNFSGDVLIRFAVSPYAEKYLSNVLREFTLFPLHEFQQLSSWYSQMLYRIFKQFRRTGFWKVRKQDFIELLAIPPSYHEGLINARIINPAIEELKDLFPNLFCKKNMVLVGRNYQVASYEFHWDIDEKDFLELVYPSGTVLHEFELEFQRRLSPMEEEKIIGLEKEYGSIPLNLALDEAATYDKPYLTYIESLLKTWKKKRLTIQDLEKGKR